MMSGTSAPTITGNGTVNNLASLNPPPLHPQQMQQQQQQQIPTQQQPLSQSSISLSYHMTGNPPPNVLYEPNMMPLSSAQQPSHELPEMREFIHMEKPPPMYPGHSGQQHQHSLSSLSNPNPGNYVHSTHLDPIEQALSKGDWSGVSDRSLLQYALQVSSREAGHDGP